MEGLAFIQQPIETSGGTAGMLMPVSLSATAGATRESAREGARRGITEDTWKVILSLQETQRRVLADALLAGVDIAALLNQARAESMAKIGRRLEFRCDVDGTAKFFGGTVVAADDKSDGWVDVDFDDGDRWCVHLRPDLEGTAWRWLPTDRDAGRWCVQSSSRKRKAEKADEAAAGQETSQRSDATVSRRKRMLLTPPRPPPTPKRSAGGATATKAPEVAIRKKRSEKTSRFYGVYWNSERGKWGISASGPALRLKQVKKDLNIFYDDEQKVAEMADEVRRKVRGKDAHGGRPGQTWLRLNFPTSDGEKPFQLRVRVCQESARLLTTRANQWDISGVFANVQRCAKPGGEGCLRLAIERRTIAQPGSRATSRNIWALLGGNLVGNGWLHLTNNILACTVTRPRLPRPATKRCVSRSPILGHSRLL